MNRLLHLFGLHLQPAPSTKRYSGIERDDGSILSFDRPLKLGQALSAKDREKR